MLLSNSQLSLHLCWCHVTNSGLLIGSRSNLCYFQTKAIKNKSIFLALSHSLARLKKKNFEMEEEAVWIPESLLEESCPPALQKSNQIHIRFWCEGEINLHCVKPWVNLLPDVKSWLFGKDPDAGKDWRQEKGMTEDEMVGWHHWLNGHEFEQTWEIVKDM